MKRFTLALGMLLFFVVSTTAQMNIGGTPISFTENVGEMNIPSTRLPGLDMQQIRAEDDIDAKNGHWPRIAVSVEADIRLNQNGLWTNVSDGRIWRHRIESDDAKGMVFAFDDLYIPEGARLYIYNSDKTKILGAYTHNNNPESGYWSCGILKDSEAIVEYYEPQRVQGMGHFHIYEVAHVYRLSPNDNGNGIQDRGFGDSDPCQVNVNCSPEGDSWQDQKNGVARILLKDGPSWGYCTGSLVNNTAEDCTPYFLTAHHCGETASAADQAQWIFYFDYEATGCTNPGSEPGSNSTTGCSFVAHANDGGGQTGSDFKLLMLNGGTPLPDTWGLYYNGWSNSTSPASSGVSIHHPSGDIMKISTYSSTLSSVSWGGSVAGTHWMVNWVSTLNGHGVTEGGSSGSPIFNSAGLIVGTLTGGSSYCTSPNDPDAYGKMSFHWDQNSNPYGGHLQDFLDPGNTGVTTLSGIYAPCAPSPPSCAASASSTTVVAGGTVDFFDNSTGSPTSWDWNFGGGGTPNTSTAQNPSGIVFSTPGTYTVTLTASNAQGTCTTTLTITVVASTGCDTLRYPPPGTLTVLTTGASAACGTGGYVAGANAYCDVAKAEYYDNYSPYTHVTGGSFYLWHATDGGNGATVDFTVWDNSGTAGAPGTALATVSVPLSSLDFNPGQTENSLIEILFNSPVNVGGNPFYIGYTMNGFGTGDSLGFVTNSDGDSSPSTAWEQWDTGDWYAFDDGNSWGLGVSQFYAPYMTDVPPTASASASTTSICAGNTITFDGTSSTNTTGYSWSFPGGTPASSTNGTETVTYSSAGTYTAYLVAEGACQGQAIDSITGITVTSGLTVTSSSTDENCGGSDGSITITASGATQYSIDGGSTFQGSNTFTGLSSGTYNIVVEDGSGCQGFDTVSIANVGGPTINSVTETDPLCNGSNDGEIVINATGATQYSIDGGSTFQGSNTFSGLPAGTYNIVVDNGTCTTTSTATITDPTAVSHTATVTDAGCSPDGEIDVSASGGSGPYQYSIDGGTTFQSNGTFTGLASGSYDVIVEDANGCTSTLTTEVVNGLSPITINTTSADETCGYANGSISITAGGGDGNYQYSIDGGSTFQSGSSFSNLPAGTYNIEVVDGSGCSSTSTETISNTGGVTASVTGDMTICDGQSATMNAGGGTNYEWFVGGSSVGTGSSFSDNPSSTTTYTVIVDDGVCADTATHTVTVNSVPTTTVSGDTTICNGDNLTLTAGGGTSYFWAHSGETTASVVVSPTSQTTYSVIAYNGSCQGNTANVTVSVDPAAVAAASGTPGTVLLSSATVNFSSTGSVGTSYSWDFGDGNTSTQANPSHTYGAAGTYTVILTSTLGNCTDQDTITIEVLDDVSAGDLEMSEFFNVYPNPTSGQVFIEASLKEAKDLEIRIFNPIGEVIDIITADDVSNRTFNINLTGKATGFYFVHIITDDGVITKRISVMK